jgi:hypothetical protein
MQQKYFIEKHTLSTPKQRMKTINAQNQAENSLSNKN